MTIKKSNSLIYNTIIYAIGNIGTKILSFLMVPVYTYYLSSSEFGKFDFCVSTVELLLPFVTLQIYDATYRWILRDSQKCKSYIKTTLQFLYIFSFFISLIIYIISLYVNYSYSVELSVLVFLSSIIVSLQKILRSLNKQIDFVISGLIYTLVFIGINVLYIYQNEINARSMITSSSYAYIAAIIFCYAKVPILRINIFSKLDFKILLSFLKFSAPLIPNYLNWWIMNASNRYIIVYFLGSSANGIFALAFKFPSLLQLMFNFFNMAWQDKSLSEKENTKNNSDLFENLYKFSFSAIWVLIPLTKLFIDHFLSAEYRLSSNFVPFLYLATVFSNFSSFYGVGYLMNKKTKQASITSILGSLLCAIFQLLLIQKIGLYACAIASFAGFFLMWGLRVRSNSKIIDSYVRWPIFIKYFVYSIAICVLCSITTFDIEVLLINFLLFIYVNSSLLKQRIIIKTR